MKKAEITAWVNQESKFPPAEFRQAVHTILHAIATSRYLNEIMIMKGGILLALCYHGIRYTKDIDFSTSGKYREFDVDHFKEEFRKSLIQSVESLDYGLDCRIQSCKLQPPNPNASFPSLKITIGYAYKGSQEHKRLLYGKSIKTIPLDYSFNEITRKTERIRISGKEILSAYGVTDLIAEKYRAILQQEIKNRVRRQDIYDLFALFNNHPKITLKQKKEILVTLIEKSTARNLLVDRLSMDNEKIRERCEREYLQLAAEIEGELPPFEGTFTTVRDFYRSLPWDKS